MVTKGCWLFYPQRKTYSVIAHTFSCSPIRPHPPKLSAVAQAERSRILERTNEGRLEAKLKGIRFGRRCTIDRNSVRALHHGGTGGTAIARQLGIARSTVYKILED